MGFGWDNAPLEQKFFGGFFQKSDLLFYSIFVSDIMLTAKSKTWMPAFAGMTRPVGQRSITNDGIEAC